MSIPAFIAKQPVERQSLLTKLHKIIVKQDKTVTATVGEMMGKEMILYNAPGTFKYGLASVKNYMSLHVLPMYGMPAIHAKYKELLPKASFQKGCINFKNGEELSPAIVEQLIADCSKIDLQALREAFKRDSAK